MRHIWGIYLRSNLDWDSETTSYMERLFELPEESEMSSAPIATVNLDAGNAETWNVSTKASLPKQMRVAYISRTGETRYKTFMPCPSSEDVDVVSTGESKQAYEEQGGGFQGNRGPPIAGRVSSDVRSLSRQSCHGESKEIEDASADVSGQMSDVPVALAPSTSPKEKDYGLGDTCAVEDEGTREDLDLKQKQLLPRISISSLD
jgi:hypothetical protein